MRHRGDRGLIRLNEIRVPEIGLALEMCLKEEEPSLYSGGVADQHITISFDGERLYSD